MGQVCFVSLKDFWRGPPILYFHWCNHGWVMDFIWKWWKLSSWGWRIASVSQGSVWGHQPLEAVHTSQATWAGVDTRRPIYSFMMKNSLIICTRKVSPWSPKLHKKSSQKRRPLYWFTMEPPLLWPETWSWHDQYILSWYTRLHGRQKIALNWSWRVREKEYGMASN